ncbi:uncharacterized protein HKW66_Vig0066110 [Vigna angularis]|uniref:Uncharacterized protein n=1 Tax=Phaseolus angularis TaxID=3914 RepID=A0A8T0KBX4_PHAAN|nr:uncharacterized protein HKW66_Vig0066110 [Vigna angularis]
MSGDNKWPKPPPPNNSTAPTCVFTGHRSVDDADPERIKGVERKLTGVQGGDGGIVTEVTILFGDLVFSEIIIESVRRRIHAGRVEAGSSSLDLSAIGPASAAGPLNSRLQRRILRVVPGHAPHLPRRCVAADKATWKEKKKEVTQRKRFCHAHIIVVMNSEFNSTE